MSRTGRIAVTALAAAGIAGAAGVVAADTSATAMDDRRAQLAEYTATMSDRAMRLEQQIHRAEERLATKVVPGQSRSAPATHTVTGASSAAGGLDEHEYDEHEYDEHEDDEYADEHGDD
jgi:hypothetical protein